MSEVELVGGHPSLDLANTVAWRGDPTRRHDRLRDEDDVLTWAGRTSVVDGADAERLRTTTPDGNVLPMITGLREALVAVLDGADERGEHRETIHDAVAAATNRARPGPRLPWRWGIGRPHRADLPALAALQVAELLTSPEVHLVRRCSDPACGWLFLDRSRNHSRRWCSSSDCGNRARVRRHSQKARQSGQNPTAQPLDPSR